MADEPEIQNADTATYTPTDLRIEELSKKLEAMEETYQARIRELETANRGLWAELHPAVQEQPMDQVQPKDRGVEALMSALGIKED